MWYQLRIEQCPQDFVEELSEALEATGALSITLTDKQDIPVLEPAPGTTPLWPEVVINALYAEEPEAKDAKQLIENQYRQLTLTIDELADQDWERAWMGNFKPQCFSNRLWICPSWIEPPQPEAINLILDPGLAFGTGSHPTTALCLSWLAQSELTDKTVIDYGCGSGILALAAFKLGAAKVQAVDIDEQALQATQNNANLNAINFAKLDIGFPQTVKPPVDLVIANILLEPLISLEKQFKDFLKPDGLLVVSGILSEQAPQLIESYRQNFTFQTSETLENWSLLVFRLK